MGESKTPSWQNQVGDGATKWRKITLILGPSEVVLLVDGVEKSRDKHPFSLPNQQVTVFLTGGVKGLQQPPVSLFLRNLKVERKP